MRRDLTKDKGKVKEPQRMETMTSERGLQNRSKRKVSMKKIFVKFF